jgi:hypothetical protein
MINSIGKVGIYLYEGHLGYNDRKVVSTDALHNIFTLFRMKKLRKVIGIMIYI